MDFVQTNAPVEIATMRASIAKRALKALAKECSSVSAYTLMQEQINDLISCQDNENYKGFIESCDSFVQERELMDNIQSENWDAYKVEPEKAEPELAK